LAIDVVQIEVTWIGVERNETRRMRDAATGWWAGRAPAISMETVADYDATCRRNIHGAPVRSYGGLRGNYEM